MGLWNSVQDVFSGGGRSDIDDAYKRAQGQYDEAQGYMRPYQQGGAADYNKYRGYVDQYGAGLNPGANIGGWQRGQINQSPQDYYNSIMKGYDQSPQAKYEQDQSVRASNAGGAASGMLGSGASQKALQQNAADISGRDQQRYFGNVMGANQMQMGYLDDYRNQQNNYNAMQQYLSNLGYGASGTMGQNSMNQGQNYINQGLAQSQIGRQTVGDIASLFGFGGGGGGGGGGAGGSGGGGNGIDWAKLAAMFGGG